jgi:hypothetical protein
MAIMNKESIMKRDQSKNRSGSALLVFPLLFAIGMVLSTSAQAQSQDDRWVQDRENINLDRRGRDWDRYGNYGGSSELRRTALNAGYEEGIKEGRKHRGNGNRTEYRNLNSYERATKGYNQRLGDRELYRRYFREAFAEGYNAESYSRDNRNRRDRNNDGNWDRRGRNDDDYGNYGGSFQLRQTALNAGFNEGVKQGREDRRARNDNGFGRHSTYQKATKDYSSRLGDREVFQRYFREAYQNGYADGYAGY